MLDFQFKYSADGPYIETSLTGKPLLTTPQLNKGTAFTHAERRTFDLTGKLPTQIETLDEQVQRSYFQYQAYTCHLQSNIYLNNLHDKNQILFYKLASEHLASILPIIYTPIVGTAVKQFSHEFRQPRGLYVAYPDQDHIEEILDNRSNPHIDVIVVTDGEGVLGIGDQGIGGMDIPVAKLMVYTLCGGLNPCHTLPIFLDVGTNNPELLDDPLYLGWRHKRITGAEYDTFIERFVSAIQKKFPHVFLHWEDFARQHAYRILEKFKDTLCTFNDDIQGTGAVALAALLAGVKAKKESLGEQRIVIYGAGSAGMGIVEQICDALIKQGVERKDAIRCFWLIDRQGLLFADDPTLTSTQKIYARDPKEKQQWENAQTVETLAAIDVIKPTILIGCSAQRDAFSEAIIKAMASHVKRPIIFPLSNPTDHCEAHPKDILVWTEGQAMIATGTAFPQVTYHDQDYPIAQCNNALVFPGLGLGITVVKSKRLSSHMIWRACEVLSEHAPILRDPQSMLLPSLEKAQIIAKSIAFAVAQQSIKEGLSEHNYTDEELKKEIDKNFWEPRYLPMKKK